MPLIRGKPMDNLLEVKDLTICFKNGKDDFLAVNNVNFSLKQGEILGIVGESGSGKSVTALSLLQLLPAQKSVQGEKSSIKFCGQELVKATEKEMEKVRGGAIAYIFQEPMSSLNPLHTIESQISESLILHRGMNKAEAQKETLKLLLLTGIKHAKKRLKSYPHELSGGQRQRVMIAMAIANNPQLLIADEPTTALDVTVQEQIIKLLLKLRKKLNMAIIFISHDLRLVKKLADRVCIMKEGKIVEQGKTEEIFAHPQDAYTKQLINATIAKKSEKKQSNKTILSTKELTVSYPIKKNFWGRVEEQLYALNKINLQIFEGECLGIVGESGSGKTTLGQALCGLISYNGKIEYKGQDIKSINNKEIHKDIQIIFQDPYNSLNPRMTIEQIVGEGLSVHNPELSKKEIKKRIKKALEDVELSENIMSKYPHEFSGGQRQRIAIARSLVISPKVIIFDEPTSALDVTIQAQVLEMLNKIKEKRNLTYVFISHDMSVIRAVSDRIAVMHGGKIIEQGKTEDIFEHPQEEYTQELINATL